MTNPKQKEDWEKEFRLEMAGILGKEGKFAMNSMVELARKFRQEAREQERQKVLEEVEKELKNGAWLIYLRKKDLFNMDEVVKIRKQMRKEIVDFIQTLNEEK